MAQPLCTLLLLLAALAGSQAWSPEEEDRVIPGGIYDADLNDDEVQHALHFAISEYNKATEDEYYRRPLRVLRAREQVVAGMNYFLDVELGRTTCTKSQPNLDTCAFHEQPELQKIFEGELPCPGLFPLAPLSAGLDAGGGRSWGKRVATPCHAPLGLRRPCTGCSSKGCAGTETLQAGKQLCSFQIYEVPWEDRMSLVNSRCQEA
ncbi:cystatin-SA-like [Macaca nemestrina]|uniref:cystatin-SA-like n=1 Tax=Macaca nemestrina TaxID=9545 RepID=UPI0039B8F633